MLAANVILLGGYTLGCHSLRHLTGGALDELSRVARAPVRLHAASSCFNRRHMLWAWMSLFSVAFADVYVRLLLDGRLVSDPRLF